jgi:prephenate dehydrogenase
MARVSHLPHAVAAALVRLAIDDGAIDLAGSGFADTTRIASGDAALWTDILRTNRKPMIRAIDQLIAGLHKLRSQLDRDDEAALTEWLDASRKARDRWLTRRYRKQELPP